jgi:hypothetical protein
LNLSRAVAVLIFFAAQTVFPAPVERQDPAIALIAAIMQRRSSEGDFSGTVLVARDGKILYENALGMQIVNGTLQTTSKPNSKLDR